MPVNESYSMLEHERLLQRQQAELVEKHHRTIVAVFSNGRRREYQEAIRHAWGIEVLRSGIPIVFVLGIPDHVLNFKADVLTLPLIDDLEFSRGKVLAFLEYARKYWSFDMLLLVSDRSFLNPSYIPLIPKDYQIRVLSNSEMEGGAACTALIPKQSISTLVDCLSNADSDSWTYVSLLGNDYVYESSLFLYDRHGGEPGVVKRFFQKPTLLAEHVYGERLRSYHDRWKSLKEKGHFSYIREESNNHIVASVGFQVIMTRLVTCFHGARSHWYRAIERFASRVLPYRYKSLFIDCAELEYSAFVDTLCERRAFDVDCFESSSSRLLTKQSAVSFHPEKPCRVREWPEGRLARMLVDRLQQYHYRVMFIRVSKERETFIERCVAEGVFKQCSFVIIQFENAYSPWNEAFIAPIRADTRVITRYKRR